MIDNLNVEASGMSAGVLEKLKRLWAYWQGKIKAGPTRPEKYIELNKPKDIDEKTWVLQEIKRLKGKPDKGERETTTLKVLSDYALAEWGEYGQSAKTKKPEPY